MNDADIKAIINDTVNMTVLKLKVAGLLKDDRKSAYQKTEAILYNYPEFKKQQEQPYADTLVRKIEEALEDISDDIYYKIIPMFYFERQTREYIADYFGTTVTTISRNKTKLVNQLKVKLCCEDVIYELFL